LGNRDYTKLVDDAPSDRPAATAPPAADAPAARGDDGEDDR
jgi:hypothetical protein